ncbi:stalk domain-containing protein [Paenibacillus gansuensis]|uniref:Stalk domain-containing protein n=1 Tax=Paenibacillus gansuensis TaxID=306542 RepID=A0ABW5PIY3_9BACL
MAVRKFITAVLAAALLLTVLPAGARAVSTSSSILVLYLNKKQAMVNNSSVQLDAPATVVKGRTYVPLRFLQESFGFQMTMKNGRISIVTKTATLLIDTKKKAAYANGYYVPYSQAVAVKNGRTLIQLKWVADYMGARYEYHPGSGRIEIYYVKQSNGVYEGDGSSPVAKFTFGKEAYRVGEPVKYVDLSYDPDAEGIYYRKWSGKQSAFFQPGQYTVSLQVTDSKGHVSEVYDRTLTIVNEPFLTEQAYPIYTQAAGTEVKGGRSFLSGLPQLDKSVSDDTRRPLLVSDSPELIMEPGILYEDQVNGRARLYANHQNGMTRKVQFAIAVTNHSGSPVTVTTTNKGEVYPSKYANLAGHQASVEFLMQDSLNKKMTVPAGETLVYVMMPDFFPASGINAFYDVETTGPVTFSFVAMDSGAPIETLRNMNRLAKGIHNRGTFGYSTTEWEVQEGAIDKPSRIIVGDGITDPFGQGYDAMDSSPSVNKGNYGVLKKLRIVNPPKMAVLVMARGGTFKGPFKINGDFVMVRDNGVLTYLDGPYIIAKTTGREPVLDIEFTPPAGSSFPIDLIFYPLGD